MAFLQLHNETMRQYLSVWFKYDLDRNTTATLQVRPDPTRLLISRSNSTFHVTEMPALTTWPSVTSFWSIKEIMIILLQF